MSVCCALAAGAVSAAPGFRFTSFLKGEGGDTATLVGRDRDGFLYVAGYTSRDNVPITDTAIKPIHSGGQDVFLVKLDPNASPEISVVYGTYIGGAGNDVVRAMRVDPDGTVYLAGSTTSTDFPVSSNAYRSSLAGETDAFVMKFKPGLGGTELFYSSYLGGAAFDSANALAVGTDGIVHIAGETLSADFPQIGASMQPFHAGAREAFLASFDPAADGGSSIRYTSFLGDGGNDAATALAVSRNGALVVAGWTESAAFPQAGDPIQRDNRGRKDAFVAKIDPAVGGNAGLLYGSYLGGSELEIVAQVLVDSADRVFVVGTTLSPDFPLANNAGNADAFVTLLDLTKPAANAIVYSTCVGGSGGEVVYGATQDAAGNVYLTGYTLSKDLRAAGLLPAMLGAVDAFVVKLAPAATAAEALAYTTYLGGGGMDVGNAIIASEDGRIAVAGITTGARFPFAETARTGLAGLWGSFVTVFDHCGYSLSQESRSFGAEGGSDRATISTVAGCPWTAAVDADWISIAQPSGRGTGQVTFTVAPNPSFEPRAATVSIGGVALRIEQTGR